MKNRIPDSNQIIEATTKVTVDGEFSIYNLLKHLHQHKFNISISQLNERVDEIAREYGWKWNVDGEFKTYIIGDREMDIVPISKMKLEQFLENEVKDKLFGIIYIKENDEVTHRVGRLGINSKKARELYSANSSYEIEKICIDKWHHNITIYDFKKHAYRTLKIERIKEIRFQKKRFIITE
jgi:hypothetical protein